MSDGKGLLFLATNICSFRFTPLYLLLALPSWLIEQLSITLCKAVPCRLLVRGGGIALMPTSHEQQANYTGVGQRCWKHVCPLLAIAWGPLLLSRVLLETPPISLKDRLIHDLGPGGGY